MNMTWPVEPAYGSVCNSGQPPAAARWRLVTCEGRQAGQPAAQDRHARRHLAPPDPPRRPSAWLAGARRPRRRFVIRKLDEGVHIRHAVPEMLRTNRARAFGRDVSLRVIFAGGHDGVLIFAGGHDGVHAILLGGWRGAAGIAVRARLIASRAGHCCRGSSCQPVIRPVVRAIRAELILGAGAKRNELLRGSEPFVLPGPEPLPAEAHDVAIALLRSPCLVLASFGFHRICRPFCDSVRPGAVFYTRYRPS
jgi:hypothetical protein